MSREKYNNNKRVLFVTGNLPVDYKTLLANDYSKLF